jgi:SRSO17 transposase
MAARLARGDPQADADAFEQALQQFVNQSPWDPVPVRRRLAQRMNAAIGPAAWVIDDTGFPKFGRWSVGVAPQYCGALGKVANCQVGVSIHATTDQASCPLDWRLFLPEDWDDDAERRHKAHVPDTQQHRPKWQLALDMLDELATWELTPPVVLADAAYGEVNQFRLGLEQRELAYVAQVPGTISAYPQQVVPETLPYPGRGQPSKPRYRQPRSSLRALVLAAGEGAACTLTWREGADGRRWSRGLSPCGCARPGCSCAGWPAVGSCRCAGCWPSGLSRKPSRSSTGWPACPPRSHCGSWSIWPSCAGEWSTITAS